MRIVKGREEGLRTSCGARIWTSSSCRSIFASAIRALFGPGLSLEETVRRIVRAVRKEGDEAVLRFNQALDLSRPAPILVDRSETAAAYEQLDPALVAALRLAAERIRAHHERQLDRSWRAFRN